MLEEQKFLCFQFFMVRELKQQMNDYTQNYFFKKRDSRKSRTKKKVAIAKVNINNSSNTTQCLQNHWKINWIKTKF